MANKIIPKRSSVEGRVPTTDDLDVGELAVNLADAKIYSKNAGGTVIELAGGTSSSSDALIFTGFDGGTSATTVFDLTLDLGAA
jgi:hypothetical protein